MAMKIIGILLINLTVFINATSYNNNLHQKLNMWATLHPGALLQALDQITANMQYNESPLLHTAPLSAPPTVLPPSPSSLPPQSTSPTSPKPSFRYPQIQRRVSSHSHENPYSAEDHLRADDSSDFDYDKAYDQFVQQYFNTEKNAALNDEDDEASSSIETHHSPHDIDNEGEDDHSEPWTAASKKTPKEKCRKVKRNRQECVICQNLRSNEKSETCSYSTETEPEAYAYNQQTSYKKQRNSSNESDEKDDESDDSDEEEKSNVKKKLPIKAKKTKTKKSINKSSPTSTRKARPTKAKTFSHKKQTKASDFKKPKDTSSCLKTVHRHKICYDCQNRDGEEFVRCYGKSNDDGQGNHRSRKEEEVQKSEKKIYKRMVSYSYAKSKDFNDKDGKASKTTDTESSIGQEKAKIN